MGRADSWRRSGHRTQLRWEDNCCFPRACLGSSLQGDRLGRLWSWKWGRACRCTPERACKLLRCITSRCSRGRKLWCGSLHRSRKLIFCLRRQGLRLLQRGASCGISFRWRPQLRFLRYTSQRGVSLNFWVLNWYCWRRQGLKWR